MTGLIPGSGTRGTLVLGAAFGQAGDGLFVTGLAWSVLEATGSARQLSLVLTVLTVVPLVAAPLAGHLIDRPGGPSWLVGSETAAAGLLLAAAAVRDPGLLFFLVLAAAVPLFASLSGPGLAVMISRLSPPGTVATAMARSQVASRTGRIAGPLLGGVLVGAGGLRLCCLANALSYLLYAAAWLRARRALRAVGPVRGDRARAGGVRHLAGDRRLRGLVAVALVANGSIAAVTVTLPLLARGPLAAGAGTYGLLLAAFQGGMLAVATTLSVRALPERWVGDPRTLGMGLTALGGCYGLLAASRSVPLAVLAVAAAGAALGLTSVVSDTRLVTEVPSAVRGRVLGLVTGLAGALRPAGTLVGGLAAGLLGAPAAAAIGGAALVTLGVAYARR
ncbi:MAG: hypothetical protein AVDCRST_MAG41-3919, partial [uncultured Corynebacteriales bacterium]